MDFEKPSTTNGEAASAFSFSVDQALARFSPAELNEQGLLFGRRCLCRPYGSCTLRLRNEVPALRVLGRVTVCACGGWGSGSGCDPRCTDLTSTHPEEEPQCLQTAEGRAQRDDEDGVASLNCHRGTGIAGRQQCPEQEGWGPA